MIDDQQVLAIAREVVEKVAVGCFTTVDEQGRPFARYMSAVTADEKVHWLYSLSGHQSHKVEHLRGNRHVCWIFAEPNYERVVTLHGRATIKPTSEMPVSAYEQLIEFTRPYAVNLLTDEHHHQYDAILTGVESVDLLAPGMGLTAPQSVEVP